MLAGSHRRRTVGPSVNWGTPMWEREMRTLFLALATSATIFATSVAPVGASEYRYCLQGDDYAGAGDCGLTSYQQCEATASGRTAYCGVNSYLANAAVRTIPARPRRR